jgi:two-component system OmpR family sensor kinase
MASLRTRVLVSVLVLAAAGMIIVAAVTYAEQRSFLEGRVTTEVRAAGPAMTHALHQAGYGRSGQAAPTAGDDEGSRGPAAGGQPNSDNEQPGAAGGPGAPRPGPPGTGPNLNLPPGTYGQQRSASGEVLGHLFITYGQTAPPAPKLPASVPIDKPFTVGSSGSSGLRYRAYATRDPLDGEITVVAVPLSDVDQTLSRLLIVEVLVVAGVLLALGGASFFVVRVGLRPLDRMAVTAGAIAAGDLSRRVEPATPRTEVGRLGLALNAMLDRLEQAFAQRQASEDRLRRFLADSSHELRTPLAAIRGYAELFRMGAARDPADTATAMRRIEEEAKRMGVLVEDLLTLARLDETRELVRAPVDLAALVRDAVEDAHATAPERSIELDVPAAVIVPGDAHQLTQVLANLLRNALVHTPAGTPIEVSLGEDGDAAIVTVRDHGPGIPGADAQQLFERFWRSESGRERGKAGAGLGLAIVAAIVDAHHGSVSAENAPDGGARFVVRLPHSGRGQRPSPPTGTSAGATDASAGAVGAHEPALHEPS